MLLEIISTSKEGLCSDHISKTEALVCICTNGQTDGHGSATQLIILNGSPMFSFGCYKHRSSLIYPVKGINILRENSTYIERLTDMAGIKSTGL